MVRTTSTLTDDERRLVSRAFTATDRVLSEVMVPRNRGRLPRRHPNALRCHHRRRRTTTLPLPRHRRHRRDIVGFVHIRDLLTAHQKPHQGAEPTVGDLVRPVTCSPAANRSWRP